MESIFHEKQEGSLCPSGNVDDSGFFSIQVISNALKVWGLELILFNSPEYQRLRINPINERSFICNYKEHWFTVRKLGKQWFNLNSLLTGPELIFILSNIILCDYSIGSTLVMCQRDEELRLLVVCKQNDEKVEQCVSCRTK
uniref:ubiquitinyl hydrolase 1 n=1 Tax=Mandrillus leucophaeus TaxID=9568 RepID=A0A2K5YLS2_MANLE